MDIIRSCIGGLVGPSSGQNSYELLGAAKKQDGYGDEAVQTWLDKYEIEPTMHTWSTPQVESFINGFIKDLPKNQLTNTNIESVKLRFQKLSKTCSRASNFLFEEIKELERIDTTFRKTLVLAVIGSSSDKF